MHYSTKKKRWTVPWLLWRWSSLTVKQTNSAKVAHGVSLQLHGGSRWLLLHGERHKGRRRTLFVGCLHWVLTLGADHNLCVFYFIKGNMVFSQIWLGASHKALGAGRICLLLIWKYSRSKSNSIHDEAPKVTRLQSPV